MADFTLKDTRNFPNATVVKAYAKSNWPTPGQPSGAPIGSATNEQTMTSGTLTFTGLTAGAEYWAVAEVGGSYHYVGLIAAEDVADSSDHATKAEVTVLNLGTDWSDGDNVSCRLSSPPAPLRLDIRHGSEASPVTAAGNSLKVSRTDDADRATVDAAEGIEGTDGPDSMAAISGQAVALVTSEVQSVGVFGGAFSRSKAGVTGNDACGGYFKAHVGGAEADATAIGAYIEGARDVTTSIANALEVRCRNNTSENDTYVSNAASHTMGIYLNCDSPESKDSACGLQLGGVTGEQWDVGIGFNSSSVNTASIRDDSSAARSILIKGTHEKAAIAIASGSNGIVVGGETPLVSTAQLELIAPEATTDPFYSFGNPKAFSYSGTVIRNSTGNIQSFVSAGSNIFVTGSAAGDSGLMFVAGKIFHIGARGKTSQFRVSEAGLGFYGHAPAAKPNVKAASEVSAKELCEALEGIGLIE